MNKPIEIKAVVSRAGRATVVIESDFGSRAMRNLIRVLDLHATLMEEDEEAEAGRGPSPEAEVPAPDDGKDNVA